MADCVFHTAGFFLRNRSINTGTGKVLCKKLIAFIKFFRRFLTQSGKVQKVVAVFREKTSFA